MVYQIGQRIHLQPGDFYFGSHHEIEKVVTVLGSCVAVVLWHPQKKIGGMCHFMLAGESVCATLPCQTACEELGKMGKYGLQAMQLFDRSLSEYGVKFKEFNVGIYGGMYIQNKSDRSSYVNQISEANVIFAKRELKSRGVTLFSENTLLEGALKITLDLTTGQVLTFVA